jgi:hypothetical protein
MRILPDIGENRPDYALFILDKHDLIVTGLKPSASPLA